MDRPKGWNMREELAALKVPYDEVLERFLGKEDFYLRILKKFLADQSFEGLEQKASEKDWPEAFKYAHTVKGLCANLGLTGILDSVVPLTEELRKAPYDEQAIGNYLAEAEREYRKAVEVITALS